MVKDVISFLFRLRIIGVGKYAPHYLNISRQVRTMDCRASYHMYFPPNYSNSVSQVLIQKFGKIDRLQFWNMNFLLIFLALTIAVEGKGFATSRNMAANPCRILWHNYYDREQDVRGSRIDTRLLIKLVLRPSTIIHIQLFFYDRKEE